MRRALDLGTAHGRARTRHRPPASGICPPRFLLFAAAHDLGRPPTDTAAAGGAPQSPIRQSTCVASIVFPRRPQVGTPTVAPIAAAGIPFASDGSGRMNQGGWSWASGSSIVGAGAVGGYTGAHMAKAGEDVTFIDFWPENVEAINRDGFRITHHQGPEPFTVKVRALHLTEAQHLAKEAPVDIAFVCTKSYDTEWAARLIKQYLAPGGYVVSLQNCMNEATIAEVVGWGKTMGCIASNISVDLHRAGADPSRRADRRRRAHGLPHRRGAWPHHRAGAGGLPARRPTPTAPRSTDNLWGERWSKLVANSMANGVSACTGLSGAQIARQRGDPPFPGAARQRGDPHRPGARLQARGDRPSAAGADRPRRRGRRRGAQGL